jgi:hypothetical protein
VHLDLFHILALILTLTAFFNYVNHRVLRLPPTIGVMLIALLVSVGLNVAHEVKLQRFASGTFERGGPHSWSCPRASAGSVRNRAREPIFQSNAISRQLMY